MRYLPLTPDDRSEMLARIGVADIDALFADIPADKRLKKLPDLPRTKSEIEVERVLGRMAAQERCGGLGAVLRRLRRLQASHSGERRSPHPALGIPHLVHAVSARDRAGHAALPVRIPDAGRDADRHGGRQRLDVRRLDRCRRGGADGASRHQAQKGGARRQPASALPRDDRNRVAPCERRACRAAAARRGRGLCRTIDSTISLRRRAEPGLVRPCARPASRSPRRRTPPARCWSSVVTEVVSLGLVDAARRDGRGHRGGRGAVDRQRR